MAKDEGLAGRRIVQKPCERFQGLTLLRQVVVRVVVLRLQRIYPARQRRTERHGNFLLTLESVSAIMALQLLETIMDLAQKANRVKRELYAATHKPEETSIRHAVEAFDAFVDGVVEEIGHLKSAPKKDDAALPGGESKGLGESVVPASAAPDVVTGERAGQELAQTG